jgi:hypothetical protein
LLHRCNKARKNKNFLQHLCCKNAASQAGSIK